MQVQLILEGRLLATDRVEKLICLSFYFILIYYETFDNPKDDIEMENKKLSRKKKFGLIYEIV